MFAYFGPETALPLASVIATLIGFVLMFWSYVFKMVKKPFQLLFGWKDPVPPNSAVEGDAVSDVSHSQGTLSPEGASLPNH